MEERGAQEKARMLCEEQASLELEAKLFAEEAEKRLISQDD